MVNTDRVLQAVIAVLLGSAGGFGRLLHEKDRKKLKWVIVLSELFISGFTGLMALAVARMLGLGGDAVAFVCGMVGWIRPRVLGALEKPAISTLGLEVGKSKDEKGDT